MIGRTAAVRRLVGLVDAAEVATDGPGIALVSGEPGIGKTRLVREFVDSLPGDVTVLAVQAQPGSLGRPFDVVNQLATDGTDPGTGARSSVERAVQHGRTVLVVEDLHWADADSVHLIEQIASQPSPRLVIIGTYRTNDLTRKAPGGELVLRLERQHSVEQIRLERLDRSEVGAMLAAIGAGVPSSAAVEAVFRRSGGIPFVIEELLRCSGSSACSDDLLSARLPWSLEEAVRQQLAVLEPPQRRVVDALAVFGDPASFDVLADVSELDEPTLLAALRELARANVLVEPTIDHFWFAHALVADAVSQQLLGRERRRMHERALVALRAEPEPDHAALVRHATGAGHFDMIVPIATEGARRYLDRGASFQALRLADEALAESPDDAQLLGVATDAAWRLDFLPEALGYARRWRSVAPTDLDRVEAQRFITRLLHEQATEPARDDALAELVALADELPPGLARGRAFGAVAQIEMLACRGEAAVAWADRALAEAAANGDAWLHAQALVERVSAGVGHRSRTTAEAELTEAHRGALEVGDTVLACRALNNLLSFVVPHSEQAESIRAELRAATASAGFDKLGAAALAFREATAAFGRGEWRAYRQAITEAEQSGGAWSPNRVELLMLRAELALEEGRPAAAMAMIDDVVSSGVARNDCHVDVLACRLLGAAQLGDQTMVSNAWQRLLHEEPPFHDAVALPSLIAAVEAALLGGIAPQRIRREMLDGWLADNASRAEVQQHADGLLLLADGDAAGASAALSGVLDDPDPRLFAPIVGTMRTSLATAQLSAGDRTAALATARRVVQHDLVNWPGWRRDRAEALLRRLEGSSTRHEGELTAREREVAALIAEGLTNGQLAERLYISPKTAAVHVSNILMKLGLSGRAEVAAWAVRHDIVLSSAVILNAR